MALADYFCASVRLRIERLFAGLGRNTDRAGYKVAQTVLKTDLPGLRDDYIKG